jgi:hypothetical protein
MAVRSLERTRVLSRAVQPQPLHDDLSVRTAAADVSAPAITSSNPTECAWFPNRAQAWRSRNGTPPLI